mmetsp:Transcript_13929/g.24531  ORF Transcript_13929/g.24531 Transcript_13929/m.24531 type:complete len:195 (+) Transcript_13929:66-650(+)
MSVWPDLCGCCDGGSNCGVCFTALCCPCLTAGENASRSGVADGSSVRLKVGLAYGMSIIAGAIYQNTSQYVQWAIYTGEFSLLVIPATTLMGRYIALLVFGYFLYTLRGQIGSKYGLPNEPCPFWLLVCCGCHFLPLIQEFKVTSGFGGGAVPGMAPGSVPVIVGQPVAAPVVVAQPVQAVVVAQPVEEKSPQV